MEKPIDQVTVDNLNVVLRFCDINLSIDVIDTIIDAVELLEDSKGDINFDDIAELRHTHLGPGTLPKYPNLDNINKINSND